MNLQTDDKNGNIFVSRRSMSTCAGLAVVSAFTTCTTGTAGLAAAAGDAAAAAALPACARFHSSGGDHFDSLVVL